MTLETTVAALSFQTLSDWMLLGCTEQTAKSLSAMSSVLAGRPGPWAEAARSVAADLARHTPEDLQRDWTQAFCLGEHSVAPHESVLACGLAMQEPRDETLAWMRRYRLAATGPSNEPEDHLGMQLAFVAALLASGGDGERADARAFARERLAWVAGLLPRVRGVPTVARVVALAVSLIEELAREP